jgi:mono/diheme cytochrome c family protein
VLARLTVLAVVALASVSCGGTAPEVSAGSDPELFDGRAIWISQCASCHGASGGGVRGPKLSDGELLARIPDAADQEALIRNGRGAMPSYAGRLSDEQIASVVRYTREVLAVAE